MASYLIEIGLNYEDKRAEIGDVIDDLPENSIQSLLAMGAISPAKPKSQKGRK